MNQVIITNAKIVTDIKVDKTNPSKVYFTVKEHKGGTKSQIISVAAIADTGLVIKQFLRKGDVLNIYGILNTYDINKYAVYISS